MEVQYVTQIWGYPVEVGDPGYPSALRYSPPLKSLPLMVQMWKLRPFQFILTSA